MHWMCVLYNNTKNSYISPTEALLYLALRELYTILNNNLFVKRSKTTTCPVQLCSELLLSECTYLLSVAGVAVRLVRATLDPLHRLHTLNSCDSNSVPVYKHTHIFKHT